MTLPTGDILIANGSSDRPVLLSERSQLIAIKALQIAESRYQWEDMTDIEWDEIESAIGAALTEILTEQAASSMANYQEIERTSTQSIPANTVTNVIFPNVTGLGTDVYLLDDGIATINARLAVTSGNAQLQYVRMLLNDVEIARDDNRSTSSQQYFEMTTVAEVDSGDVVKLQVYALGGTTVQITPFFPQVRVVTV